MLFSRQNKIAVIAAVGLMKQSANVNGLKVTQDEISRGLPKGYEYYEYKYLNNKNDPNYGQYECYNGEEGKNFKKALFHPQDLGLYKKIGCRTKGPTCYAVKTEGSDGKTETKMVMQFPYKLSFIDDENTSGYCRLVKQQQSLSQDQEQPSSTSLGNTDQHQKTNASPQVDLIQSDVEQGWFSYEKFMYSGYFFFQMIIASIIMISVLDRDNGLFQISTIVLLISLLCLVITIIGSLQTYSGTKSNKTSSSE